MHSIPRKKTIVTALAAGSLAVLVTAGVADAAVNTAPQSKTTSSTTSVADLPTAGDKPDAPGTADVPTAGDTRDKSSDEAGNAADKADGTSDKTDRISDSVEHGRESKGTDKDNVQQGGQGGPDSASGSTAQK
ncbi:MAG: hypothetical protein QOE58_1945 [Actinomycetota bacterium]|nr:hypothetical protein [Actinomycetota bacterium]